MQNEIIVSKKEIKNTESNESFVFEQIAKFDSNRRL